MTDPILDMLERMRLLPTMYIGSLSAQRLFMYLCGYQAALKEHTELDLAAYREFIEGLYEKYGCGGGGNSWATVLAQRAGGDAEALHLFFTELAAYREKNA